MIGDVKDRSCIIIDDMADTCGTLCSAAKILKDSGARKVYAIVVHPVLSGNAVERIEASSLDRLVVCNTNPLPVTGHLSERIAQIDVSSVFGEIIRRNHLGQSISFLFTHTLDSQ